MYITEIFVGLCSLPIYNFPCAHHEISCPPPGRADRVSWNFHSSQSLVDIVILVISYQTRWAFLIVERAIWSSISTGFLWHHRTPSYSQMLLDVDIKHIVIQKRVPHQQSSRNTRSSLLMGSFFLYRLQVLPSNWLSVCCEGLEIIGYFNRTFLLVVRISSQSLIT